MTPPDSMLRFCGTPLLFSLVDTAKELLARPNSAWAIVRLDDMAPDIPSGALVFIDTSRRSITLKDIFSIHIGGQWTFRRLRPAGDDRVVLVPTSERFDEIEVSAKHVEIFGTVDAVMWSRTGILAHGEMLHFDHVDARSPYTASPEALGIT